MALVPGCEDGQPPDTITPLSLRPINRVYRVDTRRGRFALRISAAPDAWLRTDRVVEYALQAVAARARLAPAVLACEPRRGWLVTPFESGEVMESAAMEIKGEVERVGQLLARLHALEPIGATADIPATLDRYAERVISRDAEPADSVEARVDAAQAAWRLLQRTRRRVAIVHHDVHAGNLLAAPGSLILLDWECAAVTDPLLDIAALLASQPAVRSQLPALLDASGLAGATRAELEAAELVFRVHSWLWFLERRERVADAAGAMTQFSADYVGIASPGAR